MDRGWIQKISYSWFISLTDFDQYLVSRCQTPKINCHRMRTRINLRIVSVSISVILAVDTINRTFLELNSVREAVKIPVAWSRCKLHRVILKLPLYFIKSKLFLISAMISSFFLSSTLNSRNFSVTLIQFNFSVKISTGQIQKWDSWTSPEMIKPVVASSESSFFLIITSSFGFWTVMFYLIEYQFSICIGNSLQVCFLRSLSGLASWLKTIRIKDNKLLLIIRS